MTPPHCDEVWPQSVPVEYEAVVVVGETAVCNMLNARDLQETSLFCEGRS